MSVGVSTDAVFKALADEHRRALLDALFDRDGQSLGRIAEALGGSFDRLRPGVTPLDLVDIDARALLAAAGPKTEEDDGSEDGTVEAAENSVAALEGGRGAGGGTLGRGREGETGREDQHE